MVEFCVCGMCRISVLMQGCRFGVSKNPSRQTLVNHQYLDPAIETTICGGWFPNMIFVRNKSLTTLWCNRFPWKESQIMEVNWVEILSLKQLLGMTLDSHWRSNMITSRTSKNTMARRDDDYIQCSTRIFMVEYIVPPKKWLAAVSVTLFLKWSTRVLKFCQLGFLKNPIHRD